MLKSTFVRVTVSLGGILALAATGGAGLKWW
jgi:hypothetical protein